MIVRSLHEVLPTGFRSAPVLRSGIPPVPSGGGPPRGWAPPPPDLETPADLSGVYESEVHIHDPGRHHSLVAAILLVGQAAKERPERRREFVCRCARLLRRQVAVCIIDIITTEPSNLYTDLLSMFGAEGRPLGPLYAATLRWHLPRRGAGVLQAWACPLALGRVLPTLPLWLDHDLAVPLDLAAGYEETCRILYID